MSRRRNNVMGDDGLDAAVTMFVEPLSDALAAVGADLIDLSPAEARRFVTNEAFDISTAFIDSDGRHSDDELWGLIAAFGHRVDTPLGRATPNAIRDARLVQGKASLLDRPSTMLDVLVRADRQRGTTHATEYYERALTIAHTVVSIDVLATNEELAAIDRFRAMLLKALDDAKPARLKPTAGEAAAPGSPADPAAAGAGKDGVGKDGEPAPLEELPPPRPLEELLAELDALIGLDAVKTEVHRVADLTRVQQLRRERGLPVPSASRHLIFTGNPGTGKTTVARLVAEIYRTLGVVKRGQLVETDRSGLVAGFVGHTATKVVEVFDRARDGVVLIDEAYALVRGSEKDFGREAIDTIVKLMEDRRDSVVVIAAGYPEEMVDFIAANPGLESRFPRTIHFPDYTSEELVKIFGLITKGGTYDCGDGTSEAVFEWFETQERGKGFGNGRLARNLFEEAVARHASRVVAIEDPTNDELVNLVPADIPEPEPVARPDVDADPS